MDRAYTTRATGLNIDVYKVAFNLGSASVAVDQITFSNGTDELAVGDEVIIITSANFQSGSFTNTHIQLIVKLVLDVNTT